MPTDPSRTRRGAAALVLAVATTATLAATRVPDHTDAPDAPPHHHAGTIADGFVGRLTADLPAVFWQTPPIECDGAPPPEAVSAPASCDDAEPFVWTLWVQDAAEVLRVDWDQPFRQDDMTLTVTSPTGEVATQSTANTYTEGVEVTDPEPGLWTVALLPVRTDGTTLRVRAGLLDDTVPDDGVLLPNLRVTPPFEFGFAAPINPLNSVFLAGDDQNPPLTVGGQAVNSCAVDEVQEASDPTRGTPKLLTRCLRLTTGPHNVGEGHFDLRFPVVDRALAVSDRLMEMTQLVHHADGSVTEHAAGSYEFHVTHGHYHYLDILTYEAFAVQGDELVPVGEGRKSGFCPADQGYGEWTTWEQDERGALGQLQGDNCFATSGNGAMGLTAGWGDFYRWQRSGQYIDFSGVGDGTYVVRATVDILDNVLETDDTDNASYALIEVVGDDVTILERGYGSSHLDPAKVLATDHRTR